MCHHEYQYSYWYGMILYNTISCNILFYSILFSYIILYYIILYYIILYYITLYYILSIILYCLILYWIIWYHDIILQYIILHYLMSYYIILFYFILYYILIHGRWNLESFGISSRNPPFESANPMQTYQKAGFSPAAALRHLSGPLSGRCWPTKTTLRSARNPWRIQNWRFW